MVCWLPRIVKQCNDSHGARSKKFGHHIFITMNLYIPQTIFNLTMTGLAIGSFSVIWRKLLNDLPRLRENISNHIPYPISRALVCGFCFTYWLSLGSLLVFNPLNGWPPPLQAGVPTELLSFIYICVSWMTLGFVALLWRSLFVIIQEFIDYQMYTWNKQFHPLDTDHKH